MTFQWNIEKNNTLQIERNIQFEDIVVAIGNGGLIRKLSHPNSSKYTNQVLLLVLVENYIYVVPAIPTKDGYFLKTVYKSRKYTKMLLGERYER